MEAYKTIKSEKTYEGAIIDVVQDEITLPNGKTAKREVVQHCGAAAILPIDSNGNLIFVRQYRHPAKQMVLEIPAGTFEEGEEALLCATRELEEETGYKSDNLALITEMYTSVGFCDEKIYVYLAKDLQQGTMNLDEDEFVDVEKYTLEESLEMIFNGKIIDSKTMVAILAYSEMQKNK